MIPTIQKYAKFVAAIIGAVVAAGAGLIPVEWNGWLQLAASVVTAIAVYAVPNVEPQTDGRHEA